MHVLFVGPERLLLLSTCQRGLRLSFFRDKINNTLPLLIEFLSHIFVLMHWTNTGQDDSRFTIIFDRN